MLPLSSLINTFLSEILVLVAIGAVVFFMARFGKKHHKLIFGFLANSILGLVLIFVINSFFAIAMPISAPVILSTILFGLPAVGTLVILKLGGIALL